MPAGSPVTTLVVCPNVAEWEDFEKFDSFRSEVLMMLAKTVCRAETSSIPNPAHLFFGYCCNHCNQ